MNKVHVEEEVEVAFSNFSPWYSVGVVRYIVKNKMDTNKIWTQFYVYLNFFF